MTFLWPEFLWGLGDLPLLIFTYVFILRRKQRTALRYASLAIIKDSLGSKAAIRRHLPPILFLIALAGMIVAAARPTAARTLPSSHEKVILAMDVAVIILLTDGQRTTGPDSLVAARLAAERGVRIYAVGFGTPAGEIIGFEGWSMRVRLDEETLKAIADLTRGDYFFAGSAPDLKKVYDTLRSRIAFETKRTEVTALVSIAAAAVALLSVLLSLAWFHRIF